VREQDVVATERLTGRGTLEERRIQVRRGGVKSEQRRRIDVDRVENGADGSIHG